MQKLQHHENMNPFGRSTFSFSFYVFSLASFLFLTFGVSLCIGWIPWGQGKGWIGCFVLGVKFGKCLWIVSCLARQTLRRLFFQPSFLTLFGVSSDLDQKPYGLRFPDCGLLASWSTQSKHHLWDNGIMKCFLYLFRFFPNLQSFYNILIYFVINHGQSISQSMINYGTPVHCRSSCDSMRNVYGRKRWGASENLAAANQKDERWIQELRELRCLKYCNVLYMYCTWFPASKSWQVRSCDSWLNPVAFSGWVGLVIGWPSSGCIRMQNGPFACWNRWPYDIQNVQKRL